MTEKNDFKLDVVSIRLVKEAPIYSEQSFNKPEEVAAVMGDCMCQFDREVVCVVNLSSDLKPINVHFASVGSLNEAMAHPRELFKASILSNAASMMLIHCHPSGNIFPSKADTMMTDRMNKLCELIGIPLLDHIIVGGDNRAFFSFKENFNSFYCILFCFCLYLLRVLPRPKKAMNLNRRSRLRQSLRVVAAAISV